MLVQVTFNTSKTQTEPWPTLPTTLMEPRRLKEIKHRHTLYHVYNFLNLDRTTSAAAAAYKRPMALRVGDGNTKYDLANCLSHVKYNVELLNLPGVLDTKTLFWEMKNKLPKQGESLFLPRVSVCIFL